LKRAKVIKQNKQFYIINRKHARIYHIAKDKINYLGKVLYTENYFKVNNKCLFIEDKDSNEIIFFESIEWKKNVKNKPQVKIMNKKEFTEKYQFILENVIN